MIADSTSSSGRDRSRQGQAVTYAAVGASQAPDLMQYPPAGYRPLQHRGRVGHGDERWHYAVDELLTGGVYRGAGLGVRITPVSVGDAEREYQPVEFDPLGSPTEAAQLGAVDEVYTATGERLVRPGDVIVAGPDLRGRIWFPLPTRVVLLEVDAARVMYAVGTLPGHPFSGEESFTLERTDDGSVWLTVRSFARPAEWWGWVLLPVLFVARRAVARRFVRALMSPIPAQPA